MLYVDLDVHHGDGVQALFWDDPQVITVSLHESGDTLFPGTGFIDERGGRGRGDGAAGTAVNVPLVVGTGDASWLKALNEIVPRVTERFRPTLLVSQHGCDSHLLDPLATRLLEGDFKPGDRIKVSATNGELTFAKT